MAGRLERQEDETPERNATGNGGWEACWRSGDEYGEAAARHGGAV